MALFWTSAVCPTRLSCPGELLPLCLHQLVLCLISILSSSYVALSILRTHVHVGIHGDGEAIMCAERLATYRFQPVLLVRKHREALCNQCAPFLYLTGAIETG